MSAEGAKSDSSATSATVECWGGVECSVVRLADRFHSQLHRTGHDRRSDDLERIAELGIRTLRYPVLWEHHERGEIDWRTTDARLERLRELGIRPIIGLLHHGAGPLQGGLLDPDFVEGLARFARKVAERYPWVDAYTPVNEPLTTARFSGMYGIWHPHGRSATTFVRAFLQQCHAIRAAMRAIRSVTPHAALVQTEDIGKTHSTPRLAYQAVFENERRWATFDLLNGELTATKPMWAHLRWLGVPDAELRTFLDDPCPPDVLGVNHYITSERFLDERVQRYPAECVGGNDRERYADVPAVRVRAEGLLGPAGLMQDVWERYRRPFAITEVQLACTREEQVRWFNEFWTAAAAARGTGIDIRAVTAWALFGAYDWDSLLTKERGHYESGAFDVRGDTPRPTLVARAVRACAHSERFDHPILSTPGWWHRPVRFEFPPVSAPATGASSHTPNAPSAGQPVLIFEQGGRLGRVLRTQCDLRGLRYISVRLELTQDSIEPEIERLLEQHTPWAVVDGTAEVILDPVDLEQPEAMPASDRLSLLAELADRIARACERRRIPLLRFSGAHVFGQTAGGPWREPDAPHPTDEYGEALLQMEQRVRAAYAGSLVVRGGALFSSSDDDDFISRILRQLGRGQRVDAAADVTVSPTDLRDFVNASLDLLLDGERGLWHVANAGATTHADWALAIARLSGFPSDRLRPRPAAELASVGSERHQALASARGALLGPWEDALSSCVRRMEQSRSRHIADVA